MAEADARTQAAVEACARPAVLKLRRANGKHKHRRWAHLEWQGADVILVWAQHEDGSEQWQWKTFGSVPPKRRTVTGGREDMLPRDHANGHALGFAVETAEGGDVLFVAESAEQRATWLSALLLNLPLTYFFDELVGSEKAMDCVGTAKETRLALALARRRRKVIGVALAAFTDGNVSHANLLIERGPAASAPAWWDSNVLESLDSVKALAALHAQIEEESSIGTYVNRLCAALPPEPVDPSGWTRRADGQ